LCFKVTTRKSERIVVVGKGKVVARDETPIVVESNDGSSSGTTCITTTPVKHSKRDELRSKLRAEKRQEPRLE